MGKKMVTEHTLGLMEESMSGNTRMGDFGTEHNFPKTEISHTSG